MSADLYVNVFWRKDAVFVAGLIIVATAVGYGLNAVRGQPLPWIYQTKAQRLAKVVDGVVASGDRPVAPSSDVEVPEALSLDAFLKLREDKTVVVLDARPAIFFRAGPCAGGVESAA